MTKLSPDAEDLIAQAWGGDEPSAFDEDRVRTRIATRLAAAAIATATASTTPVQAFSASTAAASTGSVSATLKAGATGTLSGAGATGAISKVLLVLALGGGGALLGAHSLVDEPTKGARTQERTAWEGHPAVRPATPDQAPEAEVAAPQQKSASAVPEGTVPRGTERDLSRGPSARRTATAVATTAAATTAAAANQGRNMLVPSAVREEAALLQRARSALAGGDAAEAQRLLRQHKQLFPHGALVEERTATQIMAECAQGRTARTDRRAGEFLSAYPRSPLASSVRKACSPSEQQNDSHTDLRAAGH